MAASNRIPLLRKLPASLRWSDAGWWAVPAWLVLASVLPGLTALFADVQGLLRVFAVTAALIGLAGLVLGFLVSAVPAAMALTMIALPAFLFGLTGAWGDLLLGLWAVIALWALFACPYSADDEQARPGPRA